jgi:hypothetical protein
VSNYIADNIAHPEKSPKDKAKQSLKTDNSPQAQDTSCIPAIM